MGFPELPEETWSAETQEPRQSVAEIIAEMDADPRARTVGVVPAQVGRRAAEEHMARTFAQLYRLADGQRLGKLTLEEFGRQALRLLPPR